MKTLKHQKKINDYYSSTFPPTTSINKKSNASFKNPFFNFLGELFYGGLVAMTFYLIIAYFVHNASH